MSTLSDALAALKNAVLLQERLDVLRREVSGLSDNVRRAEDRLVDVDKRVLVIETMIRMRTGRGGQPMIEG